MSETSEHLRNQEMAIAKVSSMQRYLFDLRGYLILENALSAEEVGACNAVIDELDGIEHGSWIGHVHGHVFTGGHEGLNLQQIYEAGEPFEKLIDHPAWYGLVTHFIGTDEPSFDSQHGPAFIDENFVSLRGPGEAIGLHSGATEGLIRNQFRYSNNKFHCGQVNILLALTDIGPGDGGTMVIPGSHKSNVEHPQFREHAMKDESTSVEGVAAAVEIHLNAGDALLFVDAMMHGSAKRVNQGQRRLAVYRYGPSWGFFRHPYRPSAELLGRLTPLRRQIVMPHEKVLSPDDAEATSPRS